MGACRSVDPHTGGLVGDDRRAEGEVDAKPVVLVELTGPVVPPRELRRVGVMIAGKVDEPEFEQPSDGVAFGWGWRACVAATVSGHRHQDQRGRR